MELSELRRVEWRLEGGDIRHEWVPADDVELMVEALLKLHRDPGLNPHNGRPATPVLKILVGRPRLDPGFWWTAPSLDDGGPQARLVAWSNEVRFDAEQPSS